ncbi:type VI secretion system lipoprotein TssJ [Agaribacterium haliotis]|uniref:type VI secretion system lipoprotein TssJ n=1 Tax=Agaribacterium haliotis TaxID=2013869 RepID=UPI000BB55DA6|nr:type VI secretion system lipoprotein TssJ [Agaribacterium haliotis]
MRLIVCVCLSVFLLSCQSLNSGVGGMLKLDTDLKLVIQASSDINPDEQENPSPLYLRLYQLKSDNMFEKADFIDLYEQDVDKLGADFLSKQELKPIQPGQSRTESFVLNPQTKYIALFAEFFQYDNASYKLIVPVTSANVIRDSVSVEISENRIQLLDE